MSELGELRVKGKKTTADGTKYMLEDDSWVLMRASGTEPVVRVYVEAGSEEKVKDLIAGRQGVHTETIASAGLERPERNSGQAGSGAP